MNILSPKTICITGPECSGKTFLSEFLSQSLPGILVNEFAREYLLQLGRKYVEADLLFIAQQQRISIHEAIAKSNAKPVIIDTDLTVISIWSDEKFGQVEPRISEWNKEENFSHYLLCRPDLEWTYDVLRENQHDRPRLFDRYLRALEDSNRNFVVIEGDWRNRTKSALEFIDSESG